MPGLAPAAQQRQAVDLRQAEVEDDRVVPLGLREKVGAFAVARRSRPRSRRRRARPPAARPATLRLRRPAPARLYPIAPAAERFLNGTLTDRSAATTYTPAMAKTSGGLVVDSGRDRDRRGARRRPLLVRLRHDSRDARRSRPARRTVTRDFLQALRMVRRTPLVAAVIVISLGIGIGVNTTVFSWLQALVVHPLPGVAGSASLQFVEPKTDTGGYPGVSWREYQDLALRLTSFEDLFAITHGPALRRRCGDRRTHVRRARLGKLLPRPPPPTGGGPVLPRRRGRAARRRSRRGHLARLLAIAFQRAPDAIGRTLRVNDRDLTVIGVAPKGFQGTVLGLSFDLWMPATIAPVIFAGSRELEDRVDSRLRRDGPLRAQASARRGIDADAVAAMRELAAAYPETNGNLTAEVLSFWRALRGPQRCSDQRRGLSPGGDAAVAARRLRQHGEPGAGARDVRRREVGVRLALGARPARILRLLLIENVVARHARCRLGHAAGRLGDAGAPRACR